MIHILTDDEYRVLLEKSLKYDEMIKDFGNAVKTTAKIEVDSFIEKNTQVFNCIFDENGLRIMEGNTALTNDCNTCEVRDICSHTNALKTAI